LIKKETKKIKAANKKAEIFIRGRLKLIQYRRSVLLSPEENKALQALLRVEYSNCIRCIFWFGSGLPEFKKMRSNIFLKEAKAASLQLRSPPAADANLHIESCQDSRKLCIGHS
jgi:hypothetical protein